MSNKQNNLIWGVVLIIFGGLFLLGNLQLIPDFPQIFWTIALGLTCLFFVARYLYSGSKQWGWLFPIFITGGLAIVSGLSGTPITDLWSGALFMACISAPFWIIYLLNRQEHWWALIPGWATAVITVIILVSNQWAGEIIGALVLWSIALPFFIVYWRNRAHWWALIPGFIMASIGFVVLLASQNSGEAIGTFMMLAIALPFWAIYFLFKKQWWAIIPAGIMTTLAVVIPIASRIDAGGLLGERLLLVILFLGFALPFGWLWLQHDRYPTEWAKYPAGGLGAAALLSLLFGTFIDLIWPIILLAIGGWLLYKNMRQPQLKP